VALAFVLIAPVDTRSQERLAFKQPYAVTLRAGDTIAAGDRVPSQVIRVSGVPWVRVHIDEYKLGESAHITITSLYDRSMQRLDEKSLPAWRFNSAFFNGDAVKIELHAGKDAPDAFVKMSEITIGARPTPAFNVTQPITICGANDDRTAAVDPPVGRVNALNDGTNTSNPFCTAWAVSNGTFLTAGHCVDSDPDGTGPMLPDGTIDAAFLNGVVEFNVPASQANGTTVFPPPEQQYPINVVTWAFTGATSPLGTDWAVFTVSPNSNTGVLPHPSRGFYRMTDQTPTANSQNVTVTGYGIDNTPVGTTGGENAQTRTLQTHTATYQGQTQASGGTFHTYVVDTTAANSGSPIIWSNNPNFTIGIHTNGGCTSTGGNNVGTSFGHDPLEAALQNFWGPNSVHVDTAVYPNVTPAQRNGTIFRPHSTLTNGLNATPTGGNLLLTPSTYTGVTLFNRAMTIRAPAGSATIAP
jgi:V8-like Glu-specific endopeptidase